MQVAGNVTVPWGCTHPGPRGSVRLLVAISTWRIRACLKHACLTAVAAGSRHSQATAADAHRQQARWSTGPAACRSDVRSNVEVGANVGGSEQKSWRRCGQGSALSAQCDERVRTSLQALGRAGLRALRTEYPVSTASAHRGHSECLQQTPLATRPNGTLTPTLTQPCTRARASGCMGTCVCV